MPPFSLILTIFLITNPIGFTPAILAQVKRFPLKRQRIILFRETFIALLLAFFFQFCGEAFLMLLHINGYSVSICGGVILLLSSLEMIFSSHEENREGAGAEPFIVPIATPFFAGAGLLTIVLLYAQQWPATTLSLAIAIAWLGIFVVMALAPYLYKAIGKRGFKVVEQVMGMVTLMLSVDLIVNGFGAFLGTLK